MKTNSVLRTEFLSVGYKEYLIRDIDLELNSSNLYVFTGDNGCGKTTFFKTICGLIPPLKGRVYVCQERLTNKVSGKNISYTPNRGYFLPSCSVHEYVSFARIPYLKALQRLSTRDVAIIEESLDLCNIKDWKNKNVKTCSDGELQKVRLAFALAQETKIMIFDEPTVFLDRFQIQFFLNCMENLLTQKNKTILISSHRPELFKRLYRNKYFIENRKINTK